MKSIFCQYREARGKCSPKRGSRKRTPYKGTHAACEARECEMPVTGEESNSIIGGIPKINEGGRKWWLENKKLKSLV